MASTTLAITDALREYLVRETVDEPAVLARLRDETATQPRANMQISPEQGQFMTLLMDILGARRVLEIGTFTGYSAACMALAMGPDGTIVTCDMEEETTSIARRYWREAGVESQIDLRLGPAVESLEAMVSEGLSGSFDFVFVDADKKSYSSYYELGFELARPRGVIGVDNALWDGRVADSEESDEDTEGVRAVTRRIFSDDRVLASLVTIGDGLILARKR
jgi:caffeoyl-CoA O-methyltransferase